MTDKPKRTLGNFLEAEIERSQKKRKAEARVKEEDANEILAIKKTLREKHNINIDDPNDCNWLAENYSPYFPLVTAADYGYLLGQIEREEAEPSLPENYDPEPPEYDEFWAKVNLEAAIAASIEDEKQIIEGRIKAIENKIKDAGGWDKYLESIKETRNLTIDGQLQQKVKDAGGWEEYVKSKGGEAGHYLFYQNNGYEEYLDFDFSEWLFVGGPLPEISVRLRGMYEPPAPLDLGFGDSDSDSDGDGDRDE